MVNDVMTNQQRNHLFVSRRGAHNCSLPFVLKGPAVDRIDQARGLPSTALRALERDGTGRDLRGSQSATSGCRWLCCIPTCGLCLLCCSGPKRPGRSPADCGCPGRTSTCAPCHHPCYAPC